MYAAEAGDYPAWVTYVVLLVVRRRIARGADEVVRKLVSDMSSSIGDDVFARRDTGRFEILYGVQRRLRAALPDMTTVAFYRPDVSPPAEKPDPPAWQPRYKSAPFSRDPVAQQEFDEQIEESRQGRFERRFGQQRSSRFGHPA